MLSQSMANMGIDRDILRAQASLYSSSILRKDFDIPLRIDWKHGQTYLALKT